MKKQVNNPAIILSALLAAIFLLQSCCIECLEGLNANANRANKNANVANRNTKGDANRNANDVNGFADGAYGGVGVAAQSAQSYVVDKSIATQNIILPRNAVVIETRKKDKLPLGIKAIGTHLVAGPNLSFKSSKEGEDSYGGANHKHKPGVGFQFGVVSNFVFSQQFAVSSGLLFKQNNASESLSYTSTGGTEPGGNYSYEYEDKYSYSYLSAPLLATYRFNSRLSVAGGPELNYLMGASVKSKTGEGESQKTNLTDNSVRMGLGLQLALKYALPSSSGNSPWAIQLVYDHRISRLNKKESSEYTGGGYYNYETPGWHMKSLQLSVTRSLCSQKKQ